MPFTKQLPVTATTPTAIVAGSSTTRVRIMENRGVVGWPTTDLLIYKPLISNAPVRIPLGSSYYFDTGPSKNYFSAGDIIGYVQSVLGTTTVDQDEA